MIFDLNIGLFSSEIWDIFEITFDNLEFELFCMKYMELMEISSIYSSNFRKVITNLKFGKTYLRSE
jgi:hypothetical protein